MHLNAKRALAYLIWIFCTIFLFEDILMRVFPSIIEPQLQHHFAIGATQLGILSSGFMMSYAIMQIPASMLIDQFGLRKTLPIGTLIICFALFLLSSTQNFTIAIVARFLMGMGSTFAFLGCMQVIFQCFALKKRPMMVGLTALFAALAGVFCNTILFQIAKVNWHLMLNLLGLSAGVLTLLLWWSLKHLPQPKTTSSTFASVLKPIRSVASNLQTWQIALLCGLVYLPYAMFNDLWGMPFLQVVDHLTQQQATWMISSVWIGWMIGGPLLGWLSVRQQSLIKPIQSMIVLQVVVLGLLLLMHHLPFFITIALGGLLGIGAASMNLCYLLGQQANQNQGVSVSTGVVNTVVTLCVLGSLPAIGLVLNQGTSKASHNVLTLPAHNYILAFGGLIVVLCIGLALSYRFERQSHAVTVLSVPADAKVAT